MSGSAAKHIFQRKLTEHLILTEILVHGRPGACLDVVVALPTLPAPVLATFGTTHMHAPSVLLCRRLAVWTRLRVMLEKFDKLHAFFAGVAVGVARRPPPRLVARCWKVGLFFARETDLLCALLAAASAARKLFPFFVVYQPERHSALWRLAPGQLGIILNEGLNSKACVPVQVLLARQPLKSQLSQPPAHFHNWAQCSGQREPRLPLPTLQR